MKQKDYTLEIVLCLRKSENHLRGVAKLLGTNPVLVNRKLSALARENVVDFHQNGRNKTYFLKKTVEAREYSLMAEHYALLSLLSAYPRLRRVVEEVQKDGRVHTAAIFGSYAKRTASKDSDIDLFIGTSDRAVARELERLDPVLSVTIGQVGSSDVLGREVSSDRVIIKGVEGFHA